MTGGSTLKAYLRCVACDSSSAPPIVLTKGNDHRIVSLGNTHAADSLFVFVITFFLSNEIALIGTMREIMKALYLGWARGKMREVSFN